MWKYIFKMFTAVQSEMLLLSDGKLWERGWLREFRRSSVESVRRVWPEVGEVKIILLCRKLNTNQWGQKRGYLNTPGGHWRFFPGRKLGIVSWMKWKILNENLKFGFYSVITLLVLEQGGSIIKMMVFCFVFFFLFLFAGRGEEENWVWVEKKLIESPNVWYLWWEWRDRDLRDTSETGYIQIYIQL